MEVYNRVVDRVRGALWAHHRKLLPERQAQRILAYVYNNKYEHQIRLDRMLCVGTELSGKVEVVTTPAGHIKRIRAHPEFADLPAVDRNKVLTSAYSKALQQGEEVMQQVEERIYNQFLRDLKPLVLGIRDNPEFYTVAESDEELPGGSLPTSMTETKSRTIPYAKAHLLSSETDLHQKQRDAWLQTPDGKQWSRTLAGKRTMKSWPELKGKGAPAAKSRSSLDLNVPYIELEERELMNRNWQAFLDNKHVAETKWTDVRLGDRQKSMRVLQRQGNAWHHPIDSASRKR